jgi:biotin carboxyl carrier protein
MEYEFTFGDKQYTVNIDKVDSDNSLGLKVNINGEPLSLNASHISSNCYLLSSKNKNLRVYAASNDGNVFVYINGQVIKLGRITGDQQKFSREGMEFGAKDQITTPMPGKVVKILVAEGEKVAIKQPLVIVESMKMENEIKSPANGTIKSIHFKAGDLVESGQPIIKIIPDEAK